MEARRLSLKACSKDFLNAPCIVSQQSDKDLRKVTRYAVYNTLKQGH